MILKTKKMGFSICRLGVTLETCGKDQGENRSMDVLVKECEVISLQSIAMFLAIVALRQSKTIA